MARFSACMLVVLVGCTPTISQPRGAAHLAAMRAASRHTHHGRMEEAAEAYDDASRTAERRVDRDEADYRRARTFLRLDRPRDALPILDSIADRRPVSRRTVRARFDAALIRIDLGELERAHESLLFIVNEHPGDGPASRSLALLMDAKESEPIEARLAFLRSLYERVGSTDLGDDVLHFQAQLLLEADDRRGAIAALQRIVSDHPYPRGQRWDDALWRLADLAEESENYRLAIEHLSRMLQPHELTVTPGSQTLPRMPETRLRIARLYRDRLRDPTRAAEHFRGLVDQFPASTLRDDALYELGVMWLDFGQESEGCAVLSRVVADFEVGHARRNAERRLAQSCRRDSTGRAR